MQKAFKYRFYPTPSQEEFLRKTIGCVRLVYNKALAAKINAWSERKEKINYNQSSALLTQWKKEDSLKFLNEVSCVPLQQSLRHLHQAFKNFWSGRSAYPKFKKKRNGGNAEFTKSAFKWKNGQIYIAKCKNYLPIRWSRYFPKNLNPSSIFIELESSGRWMISLLIDDPAIKSLPILEKSIGIDLGLTNLVTCSNGEKIDNPKFLNKNLKKLTRLHKKLSKKKKGSSNRNKARLKIAKLNAKIQDSRKDFLHKLTTRLVRENQIIVAESLAVKNMVKNRKLAKSISDSGWGELIRQLTYKSLWYGRKFIRLDRWFPGSKMCSSCGYILEKLPLNIREWNCPKCNAYHDRDINAAINHLAAGQAVLVCGAAVRPEESKSRKAGAMKQKPKT